jgi:nucleotide-binding universal stress UspA family protein
MLKRVLVPLDGSARAEQALPVAARLAQTIGGTVVLLRVVTIPNEFVAYVTLEPVATQNVVNATLEEARNYLESLTGSESLHGVHAETEILLGQAAATILSLVDSHHIDLILLCSHGYTGMTRWILGSVAEKVSQLASVPVLVGTAVGHGGELDQPLQTLFGVVCSSWYRPDRPPSPARRLHPSTFAHSLLDLPTG